MNNLSGDTLALLLAGLTTGIVLVILSPGTSNPFLWRLGLRNVLRRPGQTVIMLAGLMLATACITASFGLQASFNHSMVADRLMKMGNVDEAVSGTFTSAQVNAALAHLRDMPQVQAAAGVFYMPAGAIMFSERTGLATEDQYLYGISPEFDQVYGPLVDNQGHQRHFADLGLNDAFVSSTVARDENVQVGDRLRVALLGQGNATIVVTVQAVLATDLAVTSGELEFGGSYPEIIMSQATVFPSLAQHHLAQPVPNVLCVKNSGQGGLDDSGPDGHRGQPVLDYLARFFHTAPDTRGFFPTYFDTTILHPLKPDIAERQESFSPLDNKSDFIASPAARQFSLLLPIFTTLLVGAGMLLLALLCLLLADERRGELGVSRAIGLQRQHLVAAFLIEGCSYVVLASLPGLLMGIGMVALELAVLSYVPAAGVLSSHITLHVWIQWQDVLSSWCLSVLTMLVVIFITATWISRSNIIAAIRNLDTPAPTRIAPATMLRSLWRAPCDEAGQPLPETAARRLSRQWSALARLLWEGFLGGPLCLFIGALLFSRAGGVAESGWQQLSVILLIAGGGMLLNWLLRLLNLPERQSRRLSVSMIGIGWLVYSIQTGKDLLLILFISDISAVGIHHVNTPSALAALLSLLVPISGAVMLVMSNIDVLVSLLTLLLCRVRIVAPVSRVGLAYPITFRHRSSVTVMLLGLITFLIILIVINNLSSIQQSGLQTTTGDFQLEIDGTDLDAVDPAHITNLNASLLATPVSLRQEIALATRVRFAYDPHHAQLVRLLLPGDPAYPFTRFPGALVVDTTFLSNTTLPLFVRARGYTSDRQVWDAVRDHPGYAVLRYVGNVGLPTNQDFTPFSVEVPVNGDPHAPFRQVKVIGLMPSNAYWGTLLFSAKTEAALGATPYDRFTYYYFRLQPGVSLAQGASALNSTLQLSVRGIVLTSLAQDRLDVYTSSLTFFLAAYLAIGLLFGAFSIGIITSRAVVERRQQIGMLRALGFSHRLVLCSFLLEVSFVITLSLLTGSLLAWWLAYQITQQVSHQFAFPGGPVVLLLSGSYLVAFVCTILPARKAASVPPAEALRYE